MRLRIEIDPDLPPEVIIKAPAMTDEVRKIEEALNTVLGKSGELAVKNGDAEHYIPYSDILFFETNDDRVWAHTSSGCFLCPMRLGELLVMLPRVFTRASKGCVVNTARIRTLSKSPTGIAKASFDMSEKSTYISRMYYKPVREIIEETRLK